MCRWCSFVIDWWCMFKCAKFKDCAVHYQNWTCQLGVRSKHRDIQLVMVLLCLTSCLVSWTTDRPAAGIHRQRHRANRLGHDICHIGLFDNLMLDHKIEISTHHLCHGQYTNIHRFEELGFLNVRWATIDEHTLWTVPNTESSEILDTTHDL